MTCISLWKVAGASLEAKREDPVPVAFGEVQCLHKNRPFSNALPGCLPKKEVEGKLQALVETLKLTAALENLIRPMECKDGARPRTSHSAISFLMACLSGLWDLVGLLPGPQLVNQFLCLLYFLLFLVWASYKC